MITPKTTHKTVFKIVALLFLLISIIPRVSEGAGILDTLDSDLKKCKYIAKSEYQLFSNISTNFAAFKALGTTSDGNCIKVQGSINTFLSAFFKIFIGIASVAAIINIAFAGIKTMLSESGVVGKNEWKTTVRASLEGLLIALTSWLLLNTINDRTLKNGFNMGTLSGVNAGVSAGSNAAIIAAQQQELIAYRAENTNADKDGVQQGDGSTDGTTKSGIATIFGYKDGDGTVGRTGDNGIGNSNLSHVSGYTNYTGDPRSQGIAVPEDLLKADFGSIENARYGAYQVNAGGKSVIVPVVDTSEKNIDFSYGLVRAQFDPTVQDSNSWSMSGVSIKPLPDYYKEYSRPTNPMINNAQAAGKTPAQIAAGVRNGSIDVRFTR